MNTYRKYSKNSKIKSIDDTPIHTQYTFKGEYVRKNISLPDYVFDYLNTNIENVSAYLTELAIKDCNIQRPKSELELLSLQEAVDGI